MEEIWRDIKGYEGLYQVSNLGRVKSLTRYRKNRWNGYYTKEKILKPSRNEYYTVTLAKNNETQHKRVHRLVVEAFIDNPYNMSCVNHINGNKLDNRVENLEWCTRSENTKHAYKNGLKKVTNKMRKACSENGYLNGKQNSISVIQYDLENNFIKEWESIMDVERSLGYSHSLISRVCKNKGKSAYKYIWRYKDGY